MTGILATVELRHRSGFDEDSVFNNFAFDLPDFDADGGGGETLWTILVGAYLNTLGDADALSYFLHPGFSEAADSMRLKLYDITDHLDGTPHGGPIYEDSTAMTGIADVSSIPEEVALVLTTRANGWDLQPLEVPDGADPDAAPDRPRQRYSGRLYFGPFNYRAVNTETVTWKSRPLDELMAHLITIGQWIAVQTAIEFAGNWCVWSRKDEALRTITDVQVDNAFDTQRRRGIAPTIRYTDTVVP